jgi:hypothetical protein
MRHQGEAAESEERDANTRSTFKISRYSTCNIASRQMKYLKHASKTLTKIPKKTLQNNCNTYATSR